MSKAVRSCYADEVSVDANTIPYLPNDVLIDDYQTNRIYQKNVTQKKERSSHSGNQKDIKTLREFQLNNDSKSERPKSSCSSLRSSNGTLTRLIIGQRHQKKSLSSCGESVSKDSNNIKIVNNEDR